MPKKQTYQELEQRISDLERLLRKKRALQPNETPRFNPLSCSVSEAVFIFRKGRIIDQNTRAKTMLGFPLTDLRDDSEFKWIIPEDREKVQASFLSGSVHPISATALRRNGTTFPCELYVQTIEDTGIKMRLISLRDISKQVDAEQKARIFRDLIDASIDHITLIDNQYRYQFVNQAYLNRHETKWDEVIGQTIPAIVGQDFFESQIKDKVDLGLKGETIQFEINGNFPDSLGRCMNVCCHPQFDQGESIKGVMIIAHDITNRKKNFEALQLSKEFAENLVETAQAMIVTIDLKGCITTFNSFSEELTGYKKAEVKGHDWFDVFIPTRDKAKIPDILKAALLEKPEFFNHENPILLRNGEEREINWKNSVLKDPSGRITGLLSIGIDITEQKRSEKALRSEHERFVTVMDSLDAVVYAIDIETYEILFANKYLRDLFGDVTGKTCWATIQAGQTGPCKFCTNDKIVDDKGNSTGTYVWEILNTKENQWYECRDQLIRWPNGKLARLEIATNITERKNAEQDLVISERGANALLEAIPDLIFRLNNEGVFLDVHAENNALYTSDKKIIGLSYRDIFPQEIADFFDHQIEKTLSGGMMHTFEYELDMPVGGITYYEARMVKCAEDEVITFVRDVSERIRTANLIRTRAQYLSGLNDAAQLLLIPTIEIPYQKFVEKIGPASNASRIYLFVNHHSSDGDLLMTLKAEWCAEGICPEKNNPKLQNLPYRSAIPGLLKLLRQGEMIQSQIGAFPFIKSDFSGSQGVQIVLLVPIIIDSEFFGFVGFNNRTPGHQWDSVEKDFLFSAVTDLVEAIKRLRNEEQIRVSLKEKEVLLREIHHRVKNNMQSIVSLLRMHSRRNTDEHIGQAFDDCRDRVNAMSLIHEALYQSEDLARINFHDYLNKLCRNLSQAHKTPGKQVNVKVEPCEVMLGIDKGIAVGMLISELVSNSFKHAFPEKQAGWISINMHAKEGNLIKLVVQDNGVGLPKDIDILDSPSLGLQLATAAVLRELGGTIKVEKENGTKFTICFKGDIEQPKEK